MSFNVNMPKITPDMQSGGLKLEDENKSALADYFSLSRTQRMYAFGGCLVLGFVLCIMSMVMLGFMRMAAFAVFYTLGNLIALLGTMFLVGPMRQLKLAIQPVRLAATIIFLAAMAVTLVAALVIGSVVLSVIMVVIQFCALVWYCASYIPFGRKVIQNVCGACLK